MCVTPRNFIDARPVTDSRTPAAQLASRIVGTWQLLRCEAPLEIEPGTRMTFCNDAQLVYLIPTATGPLQVRLRWRVADGVLHTVHEDGSNPVQVHIALGDADVLSFDFGGPRAWYVRLT